MKPHVCLLFVVLIGFFALNAHADDLLYDSCSSGPRADATFNGVGVYLAASYAGFSCEDLKSAHESVEIINLTLMPAVFVVKHSEMGAQLAAQLAELGLTMADPAVLGVTVVGLFGVSVLQIVLKKTMKECAAMEKEELRQSILESLQIKYGAKGNPPLLLQQ